MSRRLLALSALAAGAAALSGCVVVPLDSGYGYGGGYGYGPRGRPRRAAGGGRSAAAPSAIGPAGITGGYYGGNR